MVKPGAFLALEASLAKRLRETYKALTAKLFQDVQDALHAQDFGRAITLVQAFSLQPLYDKEKDYIALITNMAMLFGASRVTPKAHTTVVGLGGAQSTKDMLLQWFQTMVSFRAEDYLKGHAMQLIADARAQHAPDTIHKNDLRSRVRAYLSSLVQKAGEEPRVVQPFASFMDDTGEAYFNMVASLHTSRVAAYGFTAEANALGMDEYQISEQLDRRTCPVCEIMHGRVFSVPAASAFLDVLTRTTDPEELTAMNPWPEQDAASLEELAGMSDDEIVASGWHVPPYHPYCRGLLVRVGKAPALTGEPITDAGEPYVATDADFAYLDQPVEQDTVDAWNEQIGLAPAEVIALLRGYSTEEYLTEMGIGTIESGIADLAVTDAGLSIGLDGTAFGSADPIFQHYYVSGNALYISEIDIGDADSSIGQEALRASYVLANDIGLSEIRLSAGLESGGWAWAKYGFIPTDTSWSVLSTELIDKAATLDMPDEERTAVALLLTSPDPAAISTLADLPIGERLLSGTSWEAVLYLADPEAIGRFRAYIGA